MNNNLYNIKKEDFSSIQANAVSGYWSAWNEYFPNNSFGIFAIQFVLMGFFGSLILKLIWKPKPNIPDVN